ncbi:MAG: retron system putative HNH endonuclease [Planctomycetota bacterium]
MHRAPDGPRFLRMKAGDWADMAPAEKHEVWSALGEMQGTRCAYCDRGLDEKKRHIEHFRERRQFPELTFTWSNLFGSCDDEHSCGKKKGRARQGDVDYARLLKPNDVDPGEYLIVSSTGRIEPRDELDDAERERARLTIEVFGLNHPGLVWQRSQIIEGVTAYLSDLASLLKEDGDLETARQLLREDLRPLQEDPLGWVVEQRTRGLGLV